MHLILKIASSQIAELSILWYAFIAMIYFCKRIVKNMNIHSILLVSISHVYQHLISLPWLYIKKYEVIDFLFSVFLVNMITLKINCIVIYLMNMCIYIFISCLLDFSYQNFISNFPFWF